MEIRRLNDEISVAEQISPADVSYIAQQGFKTILCNRPDGEVDGQPTIDAIKQAAEDCGIDIIFQPVLTSGITDQNIKDFSVITDNVKGPMLAYCRTGTRCTFLWALSESSKGRPADQIVTMATDAGYDLSRIAGRL
jgi:uncharacterized protein (TIGR01244 family)